MRLLRRKRAPHRIEAALGGKWLYRGDFGAFWVEKLPGQRTPYNVIRAASVNDPGWFTCWKTWEQVERWMRSLGWDGQPPAETISEYV